MHIWFWQLIVSPHMANLAKSLSELGHEVKFIAEREMSAERAAQGWSIPDVGSTEIVLAPDNEAAVALARMSPLDSVHICQGVRANGVVGAAQKALKDLGRKQYVIMETVDDVGLQGLIKRIVYRFLFFKILPHIQGVFANGKNTREWLIQRGVPPNKAFSFAYFLPKAKVRISSIKNTDAKKSYRLIFVGQLIERKRLDLLIRAVSQLHLTNVELVVVGSGALERDLRSLADNLLPGQVGWVGALPIDKVREQMARADCLVLPSRHDGWGAVVSEALMSGTPSICSDTCGVAIVVKASGYGGVFKSGCIEDLIAVLDVSIRKGKLSEQESERLAEWALCLSGPAGARYLIGLLEAIETGAEIPSPPWVSQSCQYSEGNAYGR